MLLCTGRLWSGTTRRRLRAVDLLLRADEGAPAAADAAALFTKIDAAAAPSSRTMIRPTTRFCGSSLDSGL